MRAFTTNASAAAWNMQDAESSQSTSEIASKRVRSRNASYESEEDDAKLRIVRTKRQSPGELRLQNDVNLLEKYIDDTYSDVSFEYFDRQGGELLNIIYLSASLSSCPNNFQMRVKKYYPHEVPEITCLDPGFECQYMNSSGMVTHEKLQIPQWSAVNGLSDVIACLREIRLLWGAEMQSQPALLLKSLSSSDNLAFSSGCDDIEMDPQEFPRESGAALSHFHASSACNSIFNVDENKPPHHGNVFREDYSLQHAPYIRDTRGMAFDSRLSSQPSAILVESDDELRTFYSGELVPPVALPNTVYPWMTGDVHADADLLNSSEGVVLADPDELYAEDGMDDSVGD